MADAADDKPKKRRRRGGQRGGVKHKKIIENIGGSESQKSVPKKLNQKRNKNNNSNSNSNLTSMKSKLVNRFKEKAEVIAANQQISHHAQRKQLSSAVECFETLKKTGDANTHTYAAIIHAYVKCGDVKNAHLKLKEMKSSGLKPCVVCYTSLLKGLCDENLSEAWTVFNEMKSSGIVSNVRTLNTLLRGCLLHGDASKALALFLEVSTAGKSFEELKLKMEESSTTPNNKSNIDETISTGNKRKKMKLDVSNDSAAAVLSTHATKHQKGNDYQRRCDADASSYEYLICLLSHALKMEDAAVVAQLRFKPHLTCQGKQVAGGGGHKASSSVAGGGGGGGPVFSCDMTAEEDDGFIDLHLARGYAMLSNWGKCHSHLIEVGKIIDRVNSAANYSSSQMNSPEDSMQRESGGRRSKKSENGGTASSGQRDTSNKNFRSHRHETLMSEFKLLKEFLKMHEKKNKGATAPATTFEKKRKHDVDPVTASGGGGPNEAVATNTADRDSTLTSSSSHNLKVEGLYSRTLLFPLETHPSTSQDTASKSLNQQKKQQKQKEEEGIAFSKKEDEKQENRLEFVLGHRLDETLGYQQWVKSTLLASNKPSINTGSNLASKMAHPWAASSSSSQTSESLFDDNGHLQFSTLFRKTPNLKVKVEFGSGTGEWCAAQAAADISESGSGGGKSTGEESREMIGGNWCAVELRADRVSSLFSRACFHQPLKKKEGTKTLENLALIQCNAHVLMSRHISPRSLGAIFVNHPEPPQQRGGDFEQGDEASEAQHMLNESFFQLAHTSLAQYGRLTIVTDNEWYARLLLRTASRLSSTEKPLFQCPDLLKLNKKQMKQMKRENKTAGSTQHPSWKSNHNHSSSLPQDGVSVLEECGNARIYVGKEPGLLAGHVTATSSYFDRLWIKDNKTMRYCISLIAI